MTHREGIVPYSPDPADLTPVVYGDPLARLKALDRIPREVVIDDRLFCRFPTFDSGVNCTDLEPDPGGSQTLVKLSPPDDSFFVGQLEDLRTYADLRPDRLDEILVQQYDILSFFAASLKLESGYVFWTVELVEAVVRLCGYVEFPLKFSFDIARPSQHSSKVMPVIATPGHGSWPSGHATEAFAVATVLAGLLHRKVNSTSTFRLLDVASPSDTPAAILVRTAMRIADNRVVGGVHYPYDGVAGAVLGIGIGQALVNYLSGAKKTPFYMLEGNPALVAASLTTDALDAVTTAAPQVEVKFVDKPSKRDPLLLAIWDRAVAEVSGIL